MYDGMHLGDHGHILHVLNYSIIQLLRLVSGLPEYTFLKKLMGLVPQLQQKYPCFELLPIKFPICHFFND